MSVRKKPTLGKASKQATSQGKSSKQPAQVRARGQAAQKAKPPRELARQAVAQQNYGDAQKHRDQHWRDMSESHVTHDSYDYQYATLFDLIKAAHGQKTALIVALDHITDAGNMGALLRSAEVVGALGVLIPNKRSAPVNDAVFRTSAGAVEHIRVAREANLATSLKRLQEEGFWVAAATEHATQDIWQAPLEGRLVVVMGAEDTGVSRLVREVCDFEFKLPQKGVTQSLNVAQAFTAIAYEWLRRTQA